MHGSLFSVLFEHQRSFERFRMIFQLDSNFSKRLIRKSVLEGERRSIIVFPRRAYNSEYVFLKKESINRDLLFNWMPKINGHFPDGVVMNMNIQLPYFRSITYRFNMSPSEREIKRWYGENRELF